MAVRKVAVTLPDELYKMVERARSIEHQSRSEIIQEALRAHFGEATYRPTDEERAALVAALDGPRLTRSRCSSGPTSAGLSPVDVDDNQQTPADDLLVVRMLHSRRHYPDALAAGRLSYDVS